MTEYHSPTSDRSYTLEPSNEQLALAARAERLGIDPWFLEDNNMAVAYQYVWRRYVTEGARERVDVFDAALHADTMGDMAIRSYNIAPDLSSPSSEVRKVDIFDSLVASDLELIEVFREQYEALWSERDSDRRRGRFNRFISYVVGAAGGGFGGAWMLPMANMASAGVGAAVGAGLMGGSVDIVSRLNSKDDHTRRMEQIAGYAHQLTSRFTAMFGNMMTIFDEHIDVDLSDEALEDKSYKPYKSVIKAERKHLEKPKTFQEEPRGYVCLHYDPVPSDKLMLTINLRDETVRILKAIADATTEHAGNISLTHLWRTGLQQILISLSEAAGELNRYRNLRSLTSKIDNVGGAPREEYLATRAQYEAGLASRQIAVNYATFALLQYQQELMTYLQNFSGAQRPLEQSNTWPSLPGTNI